MQTASLSCTKCGALLPPEFYNRPFFSPCPSCGIELQTLVFPALVRPITAASSEALAVEGAGCFYHPQKKAVVPCDSCGRFLCALCDVEFNNQHICPACLDSGKKKGKITKLQNRRVRYDNVALALAIFPMLIFYFTILTAPLVIYMAIRYWNAPLGIVHRNGKVRYIIALIIASLQLVGWTVGIYFLVTR